MQFGVVFSTDEKSSGPLSWSWQETEIRLLACLEESGPQTLPLIEDVPLPDERKVEPQFESSISASLSRASAFFKRSPASFKNPSKAVKKGDRFEENPPRPSKNSSMTT